MELECLSKDSRSY